MLAHCIPRLGEPMSYMLIGYKYPRRSHQAFSYSPPLFKHYIVQLAREYPTLSIRTRKKSFTPKIPDLLRTTCIMSDTTSNNKPSSRALGTRSMNGKDCDNESTSKPREIEKGSKAWNDRLRAGEERERK